MTRAGDRGVAAGRWLYESELPVGKPAHPDGYHCAVSRELKV